MKRLIENLDDLAGHDIVLARGTSRPVRPINLRWLARWLGSLRLWASPRRV